MRQSELFGKPISISIYTDQEAVDDGVLVAINDKGDRVTSAVWHWLETAMETMKKPPSCWPVDLFTFCAAKNGATRALAMTRGIIDTNRREALRVYNENIDGGIFTLCAACDTDDRPISISKSNDTHGMKRLWFIPNENDGITLMFPEDY